MKKLERNNELLINEASFGFLLALLTVLCNADMQYVYRVGPWTCDQKVVVSTFGLGDYGLCALTLSSIISHQCKHLEDKNRIRKTLPLWRLLPVAHNDTSSTVLNYW